ncbi:VRR-NUC domain-containing protein [Microbacterium sp. SL62]|uniref:VRR-NUC domain-containing protein n=1 Tax=Microbacterium sp. SL62 TaxID=2995139 RepID=UPI0022735D31|nr:VRR-NUC domain-containing protein [Microbacterium sp. SL62]MCY1718543.1 VRR-NUC domain-containing protein [Microbacterium sp. SL62]
MGKPEAHVEKYLYARVKALGGMCLKFESGINGVPDRVVILDGRVVFVETKAPGEKPRRLQKIRLAEMSAAGADCRVADTRVLVDALLEEITETPSDIDLKAAA